MLLFALLISLAPAVRGVACSSNQPDDSKTEGCYGWCSSGFGTAHCAFCKCRGCDFCQAGGDVVTATSSAAVSSAAACTPMEPGDSSTKDCQDFCSADFKGSHCPLCKCKVIHE